MDLQDKFRHFLTLPGEKLLFAQRQHKITLIVPVFLVFFLALFSVGIFSTIYFFILSIPFLFLGLLLTVVITLITLSRVFTEWFFHFYIITDHKLLEGKYAPFSMSKLNDVLLDQVKFTEIDTEKDGIINQLLDIGDVTITFDRPIHQQEITFSKIKHADKISDILSSQLTVNSPPTNEAWYKYKDQPNRMVYTEQISPPRRKNPGQPKEGA